MNIFTRILKIDLENLFTNPMWIFYCTGFPIALVLVLGFLTSGGYVYITSYDYYGVAIMIYTIFNGATLAANSFMEEPIKKANMRIIYSPVKPFYIYFSKIVASTIFCTVCCTVTGIILKLIVGVNYSNILLYILMVVGNLFAATLGVLACSILKSESAANQVISLVVTIFALLGGIFFRVDGLGTAISLISWVSPAKWMLTSAMQIIYDNNFSSFLPSCLILLSLTAICLFINTRVFKEEDYI